MRKRYYAQAGSKLLAREETRAKAKTRMKQRHAKGGVECRAASPANRQVWRSPETAFLVLFFFRARLPRKTACAFVLLLIS
jgi:hypothetical protein